jgi:hypothetical protein
MTDAEIAAIARTACSVMDALFIDENYVPTWMINPREWSASKATQMVQTLRANPGATWEELHDDFLADMQAQGWVSGSPFDAAGKVSESVQPRGELQMGQEALNRMFHDVVRTFLAQ